MSSGDSMSKRTFLKLGSSSTVSSVALLAIPVFRYLLSPATKRPEGADAWISLGAVGKFPVARRGLASFTNPVVRPSDGVTANIACWVRRIEAQTFQVFAINCAHLGCPVRWFPQSNLFLCPCHGGGLLRGWFGEPRARPSAGSSNTAIKSRGTSFRFGPRKCRRPALCLGGGKRRLPCV